MTTTNCQRKPVAHSEWLALRITPELRQAVGDAATARGMTVSGWLRDAMRTICKLQGIEL